MFAFRGHDRSSDGEPLTFSASVQRKDRVYAAALDSTGHHMAVGGRDKMVAMYKLRPDEVEEGDHASDDSSFKASGPQVNLLWQLNSDDFVYCVCVSPTLEICAYGGISRSFVVVHGLTGLKLFQLSLPASIWCCQTYISPEGTINLVVGGEFPTIYIVNPFAKKVLDEFPLGVETTFSVSITHDSLCYSSGHFACMLGANGQYSWSDVPSFQLMTEYISRMISEERETLFRCVKTICDRHPQVINLTDEPPMMGSEEGVSLVQWVTENTSAAGLLEILLEGSSGSSSASYLGIGRDIEGASAISVAIEQGKWSHMRLLLSAVVAKHRILRLPGPMDAVFSCFQHWAMRFPSDFLHLISSMPLQPEPEIMGGSQASDVTLPHMLIRGSSARCPLHLWRDDLHHFRQTSTSRGIIDPNTSRNFRRRSSLYAASGGKVEALQEGFGRGTPSGPQAMRIPFASDGHSELLHSAAELGRPQFRHRIRDQREKWRRMHTSRASGTEIQPDFRLPTARCGILRWG